MKGLKEKKGYPQKTCNVNKISDIETNEEKFKTILQKESNSGFGYESFPEGKDFIDMEKIPNTLNISYIYWKYDRAFYFSLKKIHWDLFLSLQFRAFRYKGKSQSASLNRREFVRKVFRNCSDILGISKNDLQYFAFEESNAVEGSHIHIVVHCKRPDKASVEATKQALLQILSDNDHIVIIPSAHTKHVQKINYSDKALKYCLKLKSDESEKPFFHSNAFTRFYNRHLNWEKRESDSWKTLGSTSSTISFLNAKNPVHGPEGIPNAGKQATEAINAFDDASELGVTSDFKDFDCLFDGNRAYTAKPDSLKSRFYTDELEYKQDMIDQYESIKAEYYQDPNDR